jgi:hypothetical protein
VGAGDRVENHRGFTGVPPDINRNYTGIPEYYLLFYPMNRI